MNSEFGQPWTAELAALDQLKKKIFYLLENYLKILACSQVSDRCPLGYLFAYAKSRLSRDGAPIIVLHVYYQSYIHTVE